MTVKDRIRVALSPLYVVAGFSIMWRAPREFVAWMLGLSFIAYGVYRIALVKRALGK